MVGGVFSLPDGYDAMKVPIEGITRMEETIDMKIAYPVTVFTKRPVKAGRVKSIVADNTNLSFSFNVPLGTCDSRA